MKSLILFFAVHLCILNAFSQSAGCNLALIRSTLTGAGYTEVPNVQNVPCSIYFVKTTPQDANAAEVAAQQYGAHMAVMNDATENFWVKVALQNAGYFNSYNVWIGTTDQTVEGTWINLDGTPLTFTAWATGEPNNDNTQPGCSTCSLPSPFGCSGSYQCTYGEDCVQLTTSATWNDLACVGANGIPMIEINLCPLVAQPRDTTICPGNPVTFSTSTLLGSQPYSYSWNSGAFSGQSITVSPALTTIYTVTSTDRYGCSASKSATATVNGSATIPNFTFSGTAACINAPVTVALTSPSGGTAYNWNFGGGTVLSGSGSGPYSISWASAGNKTVSVTATAGGCSVPFSSSIIITAPPVADAGPDVTACPGFGSILGSPAASGVSYSWSPPDSLLGTGNSNAIFSAAGNTSGAAISFNYIVTASQNGCSSRDTTVVSLQPEIDNSFTVNADTACPGQVVTIQATGNNPGSPTYNWNFNGAAAAGSGAGPYSAQWFNSGMKIISLSVTNNTCSATPKTDTVIVNSNLTANAGADVQVCPGNTQIVGGAGVSGVSYQWSPADSLSSAGISNPTYFAASNASGASVITNYILTASQNGCVSKDTTVVTLYPNVINSFSVSNDSACTNEVVTVQAVNNPGTPTYNWNFGGGTFTGSGSGPYAVSWSTNGVKTVALSVTNNTCTSTPFTQQINVGNTLTANAGNDTVLCSGAPLILGGASQSGLTYSWSPGTQLSAANVSNPSFVFHNLGSAQTFNYSVIASQGGCIDTDAVTVIVNPVQPVTLNVSGPLSFCQGNSVTFDAGKFTNYLWSDASTDSSLTTNTGGTFNLSAIDTNGCDYKSNGVTVTIFPNPVVALAQGDLTNESCYGYNDGKIVVAASNGTPAYQYIWNSVPVQTDSSAENLAPGNYDVTVTDANFCTSAGSFNIAAAAFFGIEINQLENVSCFGFSDGGISIGASGGIYPISVLWNTGSSSTTLLNLRAGNYSVVATDSSGCKADSTITITQPAEIVITAPQQLIVPFGESIPLAITVAPNSAYDYSWSPAAQLSCTDCTVPEASPGFNTSYQVIVKDQATKCLDTATFQVKVDPAKHYYIPNVFSPNGDGSNDEFRMYARGPVRFFEMNVFNRWGELVFFSNDINAGWNGTFKGVAVNTGTYVYQMRITFGDGDFYGSRGSITLVR